MLAFLLPVGRAVVGVMAALPLHFLTTAPLAARYFAGIFAD
jgi:hypothetical protein